MTETANDGTKSAHPVVIAQDANLSRLIDAYEGRVHRLLRDLADQLELTLAYVDRATVDAHLERALSPSEWQSVRRQFRAMDFDDHVGDHGSLRTHWIESILERANIPGRGATTPCQRRSEPIP